MKNDKPRFNFIRSRLRVKEWLGFDVLVSLSLDLLHFAERLLVIKPPSSPESFAEAMAKFGLTPANILQRQYRFALTSFCMIVLALGMFAYVIYQAMYGSLQAMMISLVLVCVFLGLSFRYHFWFTQLKYKRLGLTLIEWFKYTVSGEN